MAHRLAIVLSHPVQYYAPLFRELAKRIEIEVFFAHRASKEDQAGAGFGVGFEWDVDLLGGYPHRFMTNVAKAPGVEAFNSCDTPEIGQRLREGRFDAVLVMGWHVKAYVQAVLAAKRLGIPVLVRGDSQLEGQRSGLKLLAKSVLYPPLLRLFDAALYVGQRSKAYWRHYGYPADRLFASPHCIDTEWFAARATPEARAERRGRLGLSDATSVVLFCGKLVPFKRPLDLIAAASILRTERDVAVMVAGAGVLADEMAAAAKAARLPYFPLGFCNQSQMPGAYAAADILALPSEGRETWGLVANEALACGRPVALSQACGSAPDLAADGSAGRMFRTGDAGAFAEALRQIIDAPPSLSDIARKSAGYTLAVAADGVQEALARTRRAG